MYQLLDSLRWFTPTLDTWVFGTRCETNQTVRHFAGIAFYCKFSIS